MNPERVVFRNPGRHLSYASPTPFETLPDLRVDLEDVDLLGVEMLWWSGGHGVVATFPWWDATHLAWLFGHETWPPVGTEDKPYVDADQDWFFSSWRDDEFVYWVEGLDGASWERRLRVPVDVFDAAWDEGRARLASELATDHALNG